MRAVGGHPCRALALEVFAQAAGRRGSWPWGAARRVPRGSPGLCQSLTGKRLLAQGTFKVEPQGAAVFWMSGERLWKWLQLSVERPRIEPPRRSACPASGSPGEPAAQEAGGPALDGASPVSVELRDSRTMRNGSRPHNWSSVNVCFLLS